MATRTRLSKLAQKLGRSDEDLLDMARALGMPYSRASDQLSPDAEARLTEAMSAAPRASARPKVAPPKREPKPLDDPLADTWMTEAFKDARALEQALTDRALDRALNRKVSHKKAPERPERPRYEDDEPPPRPAPRTPGPEPRKKVQLELVEVLKSLGFHGMGARKDIEPHIGEAAPLLHRIHLTPTEAATLTAAALSHLRRCCGDTACQEALARDGRPVFTISDQRACDHCHGSNVARSVGTMVQDLEAHRITRLLVVGGSPSSHEELRRLLPPSIETRLIDGTTRVVTGRDAKAHLAWAQVAAIWAPTQLDHKVSNLYRGLKTGAGRRVVYVEHRSPEFLALRIVEHLKLGEG